MRYVRLAFGCAEVHIDAELEKPRVFCPRLPFENRALRCAFAGDRGFTHPELNAYALRKLRPQIEAAHIQIGYSNSRTCEIGLTTNSGIPYVSIAYLVDECTEEKP